VLSLLDAPHLAPESGRYVVNESAKVTDADVKA
jgi:hypothetical protein